MPVEAKLLAALPQDVIVPGENVDPRYLGDWIHRAEGARPAALARPTCTAEVATIMRICHAMQAAVVPQGGRTGLAGGATPHTGCVILSLERMRKIDSVDLPSATVAVEAGAVLQSVQQAADAVDLLFPLDIGGRGSCTIGGNISTNAGGNRVLRYGMMRDLVLGLEAVLANGTVLTSMNSMQKNNTGYDWKQLLIGSEGTLGVVTRAVLRVFPKPISVQTALCAVNSYAEVIALMAAAKKRLSANLTAFEVMWPDFYTLGTVRLDRRAPLPCGYGAYVLIESAGTHQAHDMAQFEDFVAECLGAQIVADAVVAQSSKESQEIWAIRDSSGEFQRTFWPYIGFDVSIPIRDIGNFIGECEAELGKRWRGVKTVWFGHAADGNIHICVRTEVDPQPGQEIDHIVYGCVERYRGSVSAEHGIGLLKRDYLEKSRSHAEVAAMRDIKRCFDPLNILNPGKILA